MAIASALRNYARSCSRPACADEPIATMSYDHAAAVVFVGQLTIDREPSMYDLCRRHLDVLSAPRGWMVRREPLSLAGFSDDQAWHTEVTVSERHVI